MNINFDYRKYLDSMYKSIAGFLPQPVSLECCSEGGEAMLMVCLDPHYAEKFQIGDVDLGCAWAGELPAGKLALVYRQVALACQIAFPEFNLGQVPVMDRQGGLVFFTLKNSRFVFQGNSHQEILQEAVNFFIRMNLFFLSCRATIEAKNRNLFRGSADSRQQILPILVDAVGLSAQLARKVQQASSEQLQSLIRLL